MRLTTQHLTQVVLSLLIPGSLAYSVGHRTRATTCNGSSDLCSRSYGNVTFVGAHDSYAVGTSNLATNQDYDVTQQLTDGVRLLQVQAHNQSGTIQLCHTTCSLFNGGTLEAYMGKVKKWMDSNPNDVVTMLIVNSDNISPSEYASVYKSAGVDTLSYSPSSATLTASEWPTLGSLIDSSTRLVNFLTTKADYTSVPYMIDEFTNIWETAFDVTDTTFDCSVNRSNGDTSTQMFLINHFLDKVVLGFPAPDPEQANTTNAVSGVGSLGQQVQTCEAQQGRVPNFMLVDFYEYGSGSVFEVAASVNGVQYDPTTPIATPLPQGSSASTASGSAGTVSTTSTSLSGASSSFQLGSSQLMAPLGLTLCVVIGVMSII
ncbi:hypothetical protein PHLGIDRAFT_18402 [Phlebiopsis gigantea 11061_1 CR5-6]|uniref:PLC-like phosphodiesterase n=1 Tax=Phlebiopsis gigantea (strain 11061_1 CR5-6) TaxID=745531 RepID=A0A0C3SE04_PHLG1|nr:hypothetical protein PHLGIDRAFT_18402 [Phlebiopsis gigantea 11061_1 CR5-6]